MSSAIQIDLEDFAQEFDRHIVDFILRTCPRTPRADHLLEMSWHLTKAAQRGDAQAFNELRGSILDEIGEGTG